MQACILSEMKCVEVEQVSYVRETCSNMTITTLVTSVLFHSTVILEDT